MTLAGRLCHRLIVRPAKALASALLAILTSQYTWLLFFAFGSAVFCYIGIADVLGAGYANLAMSVFFMLFAAVIFRGLGRG